MKLPSPFISFTKKEWCLWIFSMVLVAASNFLSKDAGILTLAAALVGVTSLVSGATGNVWGQILMVVFSVLYGIISFQYSYWGEMVTYLGMTLPMSAGAVYTWLIHPSEGNAATVKIHKLTIREKIVLVPLTAAVTALFYFILKFFGTPNLFFGVLSITTSFLAAAMTLLRSSYYEFWYSWNDLILIVLWVLASMEEPMYIPVVVNFAIFFVNDLYGFFSWRKREKLQAE